jgi:Putative sensor
MPTIAAQNHPSSPSPTEARFIPALFRKRTWIECAYALLGLPIGVATFSFAVAALSVGLSLVVTVAGIPLLAAGLFAGRWIGAQLRVLANTVADADVPPVPAVRAGRGPLRWMRAQVADAAAWRAQLYLLLKLPVGIATFTAAVSLYSAGFFGLTYWAWRPFVGCDSGNGGVCHRGPKYGNHYVDTPAGVALAFAAGVVLLGVTPALVRGLLAVDNALVRRLLGPRHSAFVHSSSRRYQGHVQPSN